MDNELMGSRHITHVYDEELEAVRNELLTMGGQVEEQVSGALRALVEGNATLADNIADNDYKINRLQVDIDEKVTTIIAKRQPAARDLRMLTSILKAANDLERIGDQAERIARAAASIDIIGNGMPSQHYAEIDHMGESVKEMLHGALNAFARMDVEAAIEIACQDPKVDRDFENVMRLLVTYMMEDPRCIRRAMQIIWAARALERIGDHSRNICEYVIYAVKGKDVRHTSLEDIRSEAGK